MEIDIIGIIETHWTTDIPMICEKDEHACHDDASSYSVYTHHDKTAYTDNVSL